jgi:hypothetical protein
LIKGTKQESFDLVRCPKHILAAQMIIDNLKEIQKNAKAKA